jgi:hypothetical protein
MIVDLCFGAAINLVDGDDDARVATSRKLRKGYLFDALGGGGGLFSVAQSSYDSCPGGQAHKHSPLSTNARQQRQW